MFGRCHLSRNSALRSLTIAGGLALASLAASSQVSAQANDLDCDACVQETDLGPNTANNAKLKNGAVTAGKLSANAVSVAKITDQAITTPKLTTAAVTAPKIGPNAVQTDKFANASVTAPKIAPQAVTQSKLADKAVSYEKLGRDVLPEHTLVVSADGTPTNNCDRLRDTLSEAMTLTGGTDRIVVFADAGTFDCGATAFFVPELVTLRGAGQRETFIVGQHSLGSSPGAALVNLSPDSILEHINVKNVGQNGDGVIVAVAGVSGFRPPRAIRHAAIAAEHTTQNAVAILMTVIDCSSACPPIQIFDVTAAASTFTGQNSIGLLVTLQNGTVGVNVQSSKITSLGGDIDDVAIDLSNDVDATIYSSVVTGSDYSIRHDGGTGSAMIAYSRVNGEARHADCAFLTDFNGVPYATPATCP